jgi:hypothetical protein
LYFFYCNNEEQARRLYRADSTYAERLSLVRNEKEEFVDDGKRSDVQEK